MSRFFTGLYFVCLLCMAPAWAQPLGARPVHIVVPFPAGGTADLVARSISDHLAESWKVAVLVDNKPGAGSIVATGQVQRAAPDGTTLLMVAPSFVVNPMLSPEAKYDALRDFAPVTLLVNSPLVLAVPADSPARTFDELIGLARRNPGKLAYAAVGPNTTQQMIGEMLKIESRIDWTYAPYPGGAPAVTAALGGHVAAVFANYSEVSSQVAAGRLRVLAVGTRERLDTLKEVPTFAELGHTLIDPIIWFGIVAPAGTPREVVERIRVDMQRAMTMPSVREKLLAMHLYPAAGAEPFGPFLATQAQRYGALVRQAGLK